MRACAGQGRHNKARERQADLDVDGAAAALVADHTGDGGPVDEVGDSLASLDMKGDMSTHMSTHDDCSWCTARPSGWTVDAWMSAM